MNKRYHDVMMKMIKIINVLFVTGIFSCAWLGYYGTHTFSPYYFKGNVAIIVLFMVIYTIYAQIYDALLVSFHRISEMIYSQALSALVSDVIMYLTIWLLTKYIPTVLPILCVFAAQVLFAAIWSLVAHRWYFRKFPPKKTAIIYDVRQGIEDIMKDYGLDAKYDIEIVESVRYCIGNNLEILHGVQVVFLSGVHSQERNIILKFCIANGISVYVIPRVGDVLMSSAKQIHMLHLPILQVNRYSPPGEYILFKRLWDIVVSICAIIITSPIMIVTAIAIKMTDRGPVFYKQCRLTQNGREFNVIKFRSMCVDAEKDGVARLSTGVHDDRITSIGRFIRKVRIDEIPQLFNILIGDMSIVGPRPERPEIARQYEKEMPEFGLRLQAKAGLTGYAQVYGKYNTTPYDKLQMDLMYIAKPSLLEDLLIMFATVKILFMPDSTEGIGEGQTTADIGIEIAATENKEDENK